MKNYYSANSLTTSIIHSSIKGWENVLFELGRERVKGAELMESRQITVSVSTNHRRPLNGKDRLEPSRIRILHTRPI